MILKSSVAPFVLLCTESIPLHYIDETMNHIDVINHIDVSHETKYKYIALRASQNKVIINLLDQFYVR